MKIKKCKKCGNEGFMIQETIISKAFLDKKEELTVYKNFTNSIDRIFCSNCEEEYSENDFNKINFE